MKKSKKKLSIFGIILSILLIVITISLIYFINIFNIIPTNYYNYLIIFLVLLNIILTSLLIFNYKIKILKIVHIISYIMTIIILIIFSFGIIYLNKTLNLFDNITLIKEEVTDYYIIVLNDSKYQEISDLYEKTLAYYDNTNEEVINSIKLSLSYEKINDINLLKTKLFNKEVESILISDIIKNKFEEEDTNFESNIRILKTISITSEIEDITKKVSIKNTPYNVLISGIDTYGDINKTSRNDVNIVATINPNTNQILLTSIPRDYYVQLNGTTGYKDKLTHASYYGINMQVQTIEDIFDIDINYYVKVNFSTVVDLVDLVGGVEVYADQEIKLNNCPKIVVGMNELNGKCALAFSRERHSYIDGDRHRGRNQQEVIKAIFNKLSKAETLLSSYMDILDTLEGKFATNMDMEEVTNFIKYEINDLKDYNIITTQVDGYGSMGKTYSYPNQDLWIMIPYPDTIDNAKELMNKIMDNEQIA